MELPRERLVEPKPSPEDARTAPPRRLIIGLAIIVVITLLSPLLFDALARA